jgi:hypothetical protein
MALASPEAAIAIPVSIKGFGSLWILIKWLAIDLGEDISFFKIFSPANESPTFPVRYILSPDLAPDL